jgi:hypothetical protein
MASRVSFLKNGITAVELNWESVDDAVAYDYFVEAFARADALIDKIGGSLLGHVFNSNESQDLLNQIIKARGALKGQGVFQILRNKGVIDGEIFLQIRKFKEARNKVLHSVEGKYRLLSPSDLLFSD